MPLLYPTRPLVWTPGQTIDQESSLAQGLINFWPCNEGGGTNIADLTGRSPGTYSGTTPTWEQSPYGPTLKLDGSTNWVNVPFATGVPFDILPPFSFSIWLFWRASTDSYNALFEYYSGGTPDYTALLKSNQQPAFYVGPGADPIVATSIPFNQWVHLIFTYDGAGATVIIYQNGIKLGSSSLSSSSAHPNVALTIGKSGAGFGSGRFINGSIRDMGIWNKVLQPSEVQQLFLQNGSVILPQNRLFGGVPAIVDITESLTDSFTLSDLLTTRIDVPQIGFSETLSFSDSSTTVMADLITFAETLALNDVNINWIGIVEQIGDSFTLSDSVGQLLIVVINRVFSESLSFLDNDQVNFVIPRTVLQDFILFTDALRISSNLQLSQSDQIVLNDLIGMLLAPIANLSAADQITFIDLVVAQLNSIFQVVSVTSVDSIQLVDMVQLTLLRSLIVLADNITLSDSVSIVLQSTLTSYIRRYLNDIV
jgi:hypothetical protein